VSQLIAGALPQFILAGDDKTSSEVFRARARARARASVARLDYQNGFWPRRGGFMGDYAADVGLIEGSWWGTFYPAGGISSRVGFVGVTRDQYGTPTGSCVVQLFRTSDDLFIMEVTSDSSGNFLLQSWYTPDQHYIVAYKAGSPDIFGTTVNTLVGA
jgi:hypothetical protein